MTQSQTVTLTHFGMPLTASIRTDRYVHGGNLAVHLIDEADGEPYATVSVNVQGVSLADDEFVFKTYSENEGLFEEMISAGVIKFTGQVTKIGPVCRLLR